MKELNGYETILLKDPIAETIYKNLAELYATMDLEDDFIPCIVGYGDYDQALLDDGLRVCIDTKPVERELIRNS